ncbi:hypothetical protein [Pseudonocardia sp. SCN 73-27]|uniref:hypothetical protein n=1 Tax=Pseudonocardia sp. SCN 73-27 TaxID=1660132 RepID=UPI0025DA0F00|nr:hypothetical protein [Pseudonocardia sp. SCN 73-27]
MIAPNGAAQQRDYDRPLWRDVAVPGGMDDVVFENPSGCPTVRERCRGLPDLWLLDAFARGGVMIDGMLVRDLDRRTLPGSEITIG